MLVTGPVRASDGPSDMPPPAPVDVAGEREVGQPPTAADPALAAKTAPTKLRPTGDIGPRMNSPTHTMAVVSELVSSSSNNRRSRSTIDGDSASDSDTSWVSEDLGPPCVVCRSTSAYDLLLKCELCDIAVHSFCSTTPSLFCPPSQLWRCAKCYDRSVPGRMRLPRIRKYRKKRSCM